MSHFNYTRFEIGGRLIRDPEKTVMDNGDTVCDMVVAVNEFPQPSGVFIPVSCYGDTAEFALEKLKKGMALFLTGRIHVTFVEKEGERFRRVRLVVSSIRFVDSRKETEEELPFVFDGDEPFAEDE